MTEVLTIPEYLREMRTTKGKRSAQLAAKFLQQVRARKLPEPRCKFHEDGELRFMAGEVIPRQNRKLKRKNAAPSWRFDFAFVDQLIAVEIEGVSVRKGADGNTQMGGRHANIKGFKDDCEKYAWAAVMGWRVLRFEQSQVVSGFAIDMLVRLWTSLPPPPLLVSLEDIVNEAHRGPGGVMIPHAPNGAHPMGSTSPPRAGMTDELEFGGKLDRDPF